MYLQTVDELIDPETDQKGIRDIISLHPGFDEQQELNEKFFGQAIPVGLGDAFVFGLRGYLSTSYGYGNILTESIDDAFDLLEQQAQVALDTNKISGSQYFEILENAEQERKNAIEDIDQAIKDRTFLSGYKTSEIAKALEDNSNLPDNVADYMRNAVYMSNITPVKRPTQTQVSTQVAPTTAQTQAVGAVTPTQAQAVTAQTVAAQAPQITAAQLQQLSQPAVGASGTITNEATVQGQLASITQDIEASLAAGTPLPAFARGAQKMAMAAMAQRGLSASTIADVVVL